MPVIEERSERIELVATILLGVATVASAWCAYQSELWNSHQLQLMADASVADNESLRATDVATSNAIVDATTFATLLQSAAENDQRAVDLIRSRTRPPFRVLLDEWYAKRSGRELPPGTPFQDPRYRAQAEQPAAQLSARALSILKAANRANDSGDRFQMRTVLLAMSLFFLGIAGQLNARSARRLAVIFGALVLLLTLLSLARLPIAPRPSPRPTHDDISAPQ